MKTLKTTKREQKLCRRDLVVTSLIDKIILAYRKVSGLDTASEDEAMGLLLTACHLNRKHLVEASVQNSRYFQALQLIAAPKRSDGTWNRDREACRQLAEEALKGKQ